MQRQNKEGVGGGKTAAAATATSKGRNMGGERQEEEEIRSFDSLPLFFPLFWLDLQCRRVPGKYEAQFKTLSGGLISSAKTKK
jgi:hypothetical protein